jgi:2-keto-4-pentenoate hydratase/2-oxohepta-3-ene-1,7-dioic acid hydratase in catechol pathway
MRLFPWTKNGTRGLAARRGSQLVNLEGMDLMSVLNAGQAGIDQARALSQTGPVLDEAALTYLPLLTAPPKIVCVGINYWDHARENKLETPAHPTFFARCVSTLIGHEQPIIRPIVSEQLDYEGELAVIIGKPGRHIAQEKALEHVAGYAVFNDASVRDYQMRGQQWTLGKNFDGTGPLGQDFVTADKVPTGDKGVRLTTRLNSATVT